MALATVRIHLMDTTSDLATYGLKAPGWAGLDAAACPLTTQKTRPKHYVAYYFIAYITRYKDGLQPMPLLA